MDVIPGNPRIVIADPLPDAADGLGDMLSAMGACVRTAYDGPALLALCGSWRPGVVIVDVDLLRNGLSASTIRAHAGPARLVAMSAWPAGYAPSLRASRGFEQCIGKPVDAGKLVEAIVGG